MTTVTLARQAMATRFEIVLHGENVVSLRAAGEEALQEVERLDARLSLYRPDSEISHVNAHAGRTAVRVSPELFGLLQLAKRLSEETAGAFDITIAPLLRCWGFIDGNGAVPIAGELAKARALTGMHLVRLDAADFTVRFEREGVMLDLGAIGKGFAVEKVVEILQEAGVTSALVHGGTSTIYALGHPPEAEHWKVAIEKPCPDPAGIIASNRAPSRESLLTTVGLKNEALSVSAVWGKSFRANGKTFGHVLDPRSGQPVNETVLTAVILPSATETDALSTALLVSGLEGHKMISRLRPGIRTLLVQEFQQGWRVETTGISVEDPVRQPV
jgi:thiamine biosynthesis lipoprotein